MNAIVDQALHHWQLKDATYALVAVRENTVYRVSCAAGDMALRLHRQGYRTDDELRAELEWMAAVARGGISVPAPVAAPNGAYLARIGEVQVDVLHWLPGHMMTDALEDLDPAERERVFFNLGREMAQLHTVSDAWNLPAGFDRVHWNKAGLLGETPLWGRFWDNPELTAEDRDLFLTFRRAAADKLTALGDTLDYGLIHADLVPANVLVDGDHLHLIDFDDGGFGYRLFDLATALLKHAESEDFPRLQNSLFEGYGIIRPMDFTNLDLFMALRAATYVGWNIERLNEDGGADRNARFITTARHYAARIVPG